MVLALGGCAATTDALMEADAGDGGGVRVDGGSADAAAGDGGAPDAATPDASEPDGAAPDAAVEPDAAVPDAGTNPPFTPRTWCTEAPGGVLADAPATLSFSYDNCCVDDIACVAQVDASSSTLDLTVTADDFSQVCDCDLSVAERACNLPALAAGTWSVRINGVYGFDLPVLATGDDGPGKLCFDPAGPVEGGMLRCETPPQAWANVAEACHHRQGLDASHTGLRIVDACGGCFEHFAGCSTRVDGDTLHVTPLKRHCACDTCGACPEVCMQSEVRCVLPPLPAGDYTVSYEAAAGATTLEILDYTMLSGALDTTEVCAGAGP